MLKGLVVAVWLIFGLAAQGSAQAVSTASRRADLQVGVGFVVASPDYKPGKLHGVAFYTTLDFTNHLGGEFEIHQANSPNNDDLYQRTYEIGPRYHRDYGIFAPYVKVMYGRGVFNFPFGTANLAYNLFAGGGGVDVHLRPYLNVRADYEYQRWMSFPPNGLTPRVLTIGVAYRFPGQLRRSRHY